MARAKRKDRRIKLPLTTVVGLSFGAFVALAIGLVLALSVTANFRNTFSLLNDKTILSTQALEQQLRTHFESVENAVVGLKTYFDDGSFRFDSPDRVLEDLSVALNANRDITALRVTDRDGQRLGIFRSRTGKLWRIESDRPAPGMTVQDISKYGVDSGPVWGALILNKAGLFVNVSVPLVRDGQVVALLTAASSIDSLAEIIVSLDEGADDTVFIVGGDGQVIMHSDADRLQTGGSIADRLPGPRGSVGDPVLSALGDGERMDEFKKAAELGIDVSFVEAGGDEYLLMYKELAGFTDKPMIIGQYFLGATVSREVRRLAGSLMVGFGALVISVLIAFWMGKRVARPLRYLAVQSERVGSLSLNDVEPLPRSRIAEIDQVAQAFNAMVEGLKAMNTYVPRSLFIKLMRLGGGDAAEAREAELTVLFTDIVSFTARSEHLSAAETAQVLNDHFAILVEAVESEGGTVDKFLGDGMLAFWGAPDARPDHAEAAVRTARKIARALHAENRKANGHGEPVLALRIGIHTGQAVVGNVGALDRWNYTVVGDTVNAAERLQTLGKEVPGEPEVTILASADTVAQLPSETSLRPVGAHHLRGRKGLMDVYWIDPFPAEDARQMAKTETVPAAQ
ncbi:adenylate/guanylate cyclase domain-containing protein [Roseibium aggregatum]|uniref:Adenylate/guanylate cyclase domain-containing protein n=1 Tax=Roseibium aggregatum TaxID=187304 RepID=A0A939ED81_9HYPH|nr:adenylate/guanylate cyclase domain-containing protein [Roseibium aggregatum]MBN9669715.1 adenylate/guanylate cyclase domain-containing protein [Roseibium aggregatum]